MHNRANSALYRLSSSHVEQHRFATCCIGECALPEAIHNLTSSAGVISTEPPAPQPIIRAHQIEKYYAQPSQNRIQVISPTDLSIVPGEILALLGPSGSGKSTMLRMLTGLSRPSAGQVFWHEKPISQAEINVSIVFQSFAL